MGNCNCHTEINFAGSGQLERYLEALDPSYVSIDGRSIEDLLVYAAGYADQIRFYDMPGSPVTDNQPAKVSWVEFFQRDMAIIAASIATVDLDQIKSDYDAIDNQILITPTVELYKELFNQIAAIVTKVDQWFSIAIPGNPLYGDVNLAINSTLKTQLKNAIAYEEGFVIVDSKTVLNIDYTKVLNQQEWGLNDAVDPNFDIYQGTTQADKILSAVPYVDDVFHAFFGVISNIVDSSPGYLSYALTQYPSHQPYMGLFITFIKLFSIVQEQMNGLTERMLNYYYKDVLKLAKKPAVPDKVYLIFQLAQNIAEYDLTPGTSLTAGKDASGKDQVYQTLNDFVISQASVKELKTIFIDKSPANALGISSTINTIYADPVANSQDGYGTKFTVPNPKWPTFGMGALSVSDPKNICEYVNQQEAALNIKNTATIGFAIASPQLVLQGGNRLIKCTIPVDLTQFPAGTNLLANIKLEIALTGEKSWVTIDRQLNVGETTAVEKIMTSYIFPDPVPDPDPTKDLLSKSGFLFTTETGIAADGTTNNTSYGVLYIYLPISEQGIISFDPKLHPDHSYNTTYPVMQVLIGPDIGLPADLFNTVSVNQLSITVQVGSINLIDNYSDQETNSPNFDGLKTLTILNANGTITPGKAFDPFTVLPAYGMSFYIGSPEVFNKPFDDAPVDIGQSNSVTNMYSQLTVNVNRTITGGNDSPEYRVSVLKNRNWQGVTSPTGYDFTRESLSYNILYYDNDSQNTRILLDRSPVEYPANLDVNTDKGFLKIDNLLGGVNDDGVLPSVQDRLNSAPFYQIQDISINYRSNLTSLDPAIDQFFHIYPFGTVETTIAKVTPGSTDVTFVKPTDEPLMVNANGVMLPQFTYTSPASQYKSDALDTNDRKDPVPVFSTSPSFHRSTLDKLIYDASGLNSQISANNQYSGTIQEEGMLLIGVEKLQALQTLSLLFEFADGSAVDEDDDPPPINWSYLIYNEWRPLNSDNVLSDSTYGFQTTGIIQISVPQDANDNHTIATDGLYWFCASVTNCSNRIPQLIDVIAQATEAQFFDQGNSPAHYNNALPAGSISKLSVAVSQISKVQQPFATFDGKHAEAGKEYYTRVSERLRHKGRAVTPWDYEHLVLDHFPQVFKVKCIPNTNPGCLCPATSQAVAAAADCCSPVAAPGHVLIVPVPNLQNDNAANPLQPKTNRLTLIEIVNYLTPLTSPFVTVHAKNPVYEQVIVFFRVQFLSGIDKGYYLKVLNDEIVQYLTPWAFNAAIEADFDQKIYASAVITFIEQRPYVDFITDFLMGVCRDECCPPVKPATPAVTAESFIDDLNGVSGCNDIESFLKDQGYFKGEVIAEPSTPMSLLVSAPKHIILLYDEPTPPTVCEKRQLILQNPPAKTTAPGNVTANIAAPENEQKAIAETSSVPNETEALAKPEDTQETKPDVASEEQNGTVMSAEETQEEEEKPNAIENAIEEFDKMVHDQTNKLAEKGKAAVKKAEDFIKNVVKGRSSETPRELDPGTENKGLPPASDKS